MAARTRASQAERAGFVQLTKKAEAGECFGLLEKNWRRPTLAEPIEPLPSARLCLTAVLGILKSFPIFRRNAPAHDPLNLAQEHSQLRN